MTPAVLLGENTRREFRQRMATGELQACILPTAAIEQHLEHLAMEHDWRSVNWVAQAVAERLQPRVIVAQGLMVGVSEHHMNHPGTLTLRPGTFLVVLADLVRSLVSAGFQNILVLNGHGGNIAACKSNWDQFLREFQVNLQFLSYWDVLTAEDAKLLRGGQRMPEDLPGHAQEFETALAMYAFPENIRTDAMEDQTDQTPSQATAEIGEQLCDRIVERVAVYVEQMINGARSQRVPSFNS